MQNFHVIKNDYVTYYLIFKKKVPQEEKKKRKKYTITYTPDNLFHESEKKKRRRKSRCSHKFDFFWCYFSNITIYSMQFFHFNGNKEDKIASLKKKKN